MADAKLAGQSRPHAAAQDRATHPRARPDGRHRRGTSPGPGGRAAHHTPDAAARPARRAAAGGRRRPGARAGGQGRRVAGSGWPRSRSCATPSRDFRQSGKLAVAWSESFGDFVRGNVPYYLATGFDRIYLQPSGTARAHRRRRRAGLPARRAREARHRFPVRQALRVQVGRRPADRDRVHRPGPGGGRPARRVGDRAAGGGDRGRPRADRRAVAGAARARAVPRASRRCPRGWWTGCSTATRSTSRSARRPGPTRRCSTCSATGARSRISDLPRRLGSGVQRADAGAARAVRRDDLRARRDQAGPQRPGRPRRRRDGLGHGGGGAAGGGGRRGRARRRAPGEQPGRLRTSRPT